MTLLKIRLKYYEFLSKHYANFYEKILTRFHRKTINSMISCNVLHSYQTPPLENKEKVRLTFTLPLDNSISEHKNNHVNRVLEEDYLLYKDFDYKDFIEDVNEKNLDYCLSVIHMNIRSLNANLLEFECFLSQLKHKIDIIVLSECWIKEDIQIYENYFDQYQLKFTYGKNKSGGIVIFSNTNSVSVINVQDNIIEEADSILITFDWSNLKNQNLLCLYRSPSNNPKVFVDKLTSFVRESNKSYLFGILGDINLDMKKQYVNSMVLKCCMTHYLNAV